MYLRQSTFRRTFFPAGILWLSVTFLPPSCKKVEHYAQLVDAQPYLLADYPTAYLVGDTATFDGKFFLGEAGSKIQIGNDTPHILARTRLFDGPNPYTHQPDSMDKIKFLITSSMGVGNNIPVSVTAHGVTITGPSLSVRQFKGILPKTDTTLYVDSLAGFLPVDAGFYQNNGLPLVQNMNVSGNGTLSFNNLTGIYTVNNGQVAQVLHAGSQLQENGTPFTIQLFLGSAITFGGDSIFFSAQVLENIPDTATAYIFRLCKLNITAGTVTTLNRTEVQKGFGATNETGGPYEGTSNKLNVVAANLKTDVNSNLYFVNLYSPARTDHDNTAQWYLSDGISMGIPDINIFGDAYAYLNICRMAGSGQVKSLFYQSGPLTQFLYTNLYTVPGYPIAQASDYLLSQDGSKAIVPTHWDPSFGYISLGYYDLQEGTPLGASSYSAENYRFFSYDTSSVTGYPGSAFLFSQSIPPNDIQVQFSFFNPPLGFAGLLTQYLLLPDGYIVYQPGSPSLLAASFQNKAAYCYAGTEAGLYYQLTPSVQNQTTGRAKYVSFPGTLLPGSFLLGTLFATGEDRLGGIYYYSGYQDYVNGLHFYKLYAKK